MRYDYTVRASEEVKDQVFHLSCGFYETTYFLFEGYDRVAAIHYSGEFRFYTADWKLLSTHKARPMTDGRGCYMDVTVTTEPDGIRFRLPEYDWCDHFPHCDGESDRWSATITGIREEVFLPAAK